MDIPQFALHEALEETHWWFKARRSLILDLLSVLIAKNASVVDVGCGTGANTAAVAKLCTCMGIDPIQEAITSAQKRFPSVVFRKGTAPNDCPEIQTADMVLLLDVLEHVEDDFYFVSLLLSQMKPDAYLILMAPADIHLWSTHDRGFDHYRRYSEERFRMLWSALPVREILASHWNVTFYWPIRVLRKILRILKISLGDAQTDLTMPIKPINTLLKVLVSGENKKILKTLDKKCNGYHHGVSILGIIQKTQEEVKPHKRPSSLPLDKTPWKEL